jgi:uncharacterized membrane protein
MPEKNFSQQNKNDIDKNKNVAALSYIWILFLIPLLNKKRSKFSQFHAKQGFMLFLLSFATIVPFFGQILGLIILIFAVLGFVKTLSGEWWKTPYIYDWSKKIKL